MLSCGACTEQAETKMWHGYPRGAAGTAGDQGLLLLISQYMHKPHHEATKQNLCCCLKPPSGEQRMVKRITLLEKVKQKKTNHGKRARAPLHGSGQLPWLTLCRYAWNASSVEFAESPGYHDACS